MLATEMHWAMARVDRRSSGVGRMTMLCMVLAGASFGCATSRSSPFVDSSEMRIEIQVENRSFELATVHAIWQGKQIRLGTIGGTLTENYTLAWDRSLLLHFRIDLLAGPKCTTSEIWADPGDIIILEIDTRLFSAGCLE